MNKITLIFLSLLASTAVSARTPEPDVEVEAEISPEVVQALETLAHHGLISCNEKNQCFINSNNEIDEFLDLLRKEGVLREMRTASDTWCI
ncbi:MAG: hypothetical protein H6624_15525 [Bdellovibrionaceae bacterium]|nr:hypothetical protein [Pseudobdellovibrionaceae bacterium]